MKFGLFGGALATSTEASDSQNYKQFLDYVCAADELGFHSIFVVEHHFTGIGQVSATLNLLSYLAARTSRIRLGTGVTVLPWHNPALLAEQIATLDLLSGGRTDVGVGKGYRPKEFQGFAIPIAEAEQRYEETLEFLIRAWTEKGRFSHHGSHWRFDDIVIEPAPVQRPHPPIWIGAKSTPSIQKAAARGFNLLLDHWALADEVMARLNVYANALKAHGRRFEPSRVGLARAVQITRSEEARREVIGQRAKFLLDAGLVTAGPADLQGGGNANLADLAWQRAEQGAVIGQAEEIIPKLKALQAAGVEYVLLADVGKSTETLREFAAEIMPELARAS
ncbi:MAG TPA: LLM class flavin-dependent oxidoreductase [Steroidobacteraceae bacterium]|nr:LLM class flavin-dependent oxidoreductase [Steroidobacteraceae bacterium]